MKIKTEDLIGSTLDWAVAKCEGATNFRFDTVATYWVTLDGEDRALRYGWAQSYLPSTNWAQGGPIIEREGMGVYPTTMRGQEGAFNWEAKIDLDEGDAMMETQYGPTPLIAAMRCYVASELGEEIEIPEELV